MILNKGHQIEYLLDYKSGKIKKGLGIDCPFDENLRFKPKQLCIILGHDNVGKTYWINWYFLSLSLKHDLKWIIWSGENQSGQIVRDLIQMLSGRPFKELLNDEIVRYSNKIDYWFTFIDNSILYKPEQLLKLFAESDADGCLIDPYTGLDRAMSWEENYRFLNMTRQFCNSTGKTVYINTHPTTDSGRQGNIYPEKHHWHGHLRPPLKDHVEGGKSFLNRCDDMIVIHRLIKHESMRFITLVNVEKIKDMDTGGKHTMIDNPILFEYNNGLGFTNDGVDPIKAYRDKSNNNITFDKPPIINNDDFSSYTYHKTELPF
jgi:hypothetical protein